MGKTRVPRDLSDARFGGTLDETADELVVGEAVALDVQPAGIVLRLAAALLDGVCLVALLAMLLFGLARVWPPGADTVWLFPLGIGAAVTVLVLVPAGVETVTRGKSVGRYAAGTRVVRVDGGAIGFRHAFTRALVGLLELWSTLGSVAFVVALFGSRPRRLGDLLAGTFVQHERGARRRDVEVLLPVELVPWAAVADVSALPQRLEDRLGAFFRSAATCGRKRARPPRGCSRRRSRSTPPRCRTSTPRCSSRASSPCGGSATCGHCGRGQHCSTVRRPSPGRGRRASRAEALAPPRAATGAAQQRGAGAVSTGSGPACRGPRRAHRCRRPAPAGAR